MSKAKAFLRWTEPLVFVLSRLGIECSVNPPTRGQMRRYYERADQTPEDASAAALDQLRGDTLAILCEGSDVPLDALAADEEIEILWAIIARHHGHDPADAIALQRLAAQKKSLLATLSASGSGDSPDSTATPSTSPSI